MAAQLVVVTGIPGSFTNGPPLAMEKAGWSILWPQQDLELYAAKERYKDGENPEVTRMHESLLAQAGEGWFTDRAPRFYDVPYPGPEEILGQYPQDARVILADTRFCLFLPLWMPYLDQLVVCTIPADLSAQRIQGWLKGQVGMDVCRLVSHHYESRLREHAAGIPRLELAEQELRSGQFVGRLQAWLSKSSF